MQTMRANYAHFLGVWPALFIRSLLPDYFSVNQLELVADFNDEIIFLGFLYEFEFDGFFLAFAVLAKAIAESIDEEVFDILCPLGLPVAVAGDAV